MDTEKESWIRLEHAIAPALGVPTIKDTKNMDEVKKAFESASNMKLIMFKEMQPTLLYLGWPGRKVLLEFIQFRRDTNEVVVRDVMTMSIFPMKEDAHVIALDDQDTAHDWADRMKTSYSGEKSRSRERKAIKKAKNLNIIGGDVKMSKKGNSATVESSENKSENKEVKQMGKREEMNGMREQVRTVAKNLGFKEVKKAAYSKFQADNGKGKSDTAAILESRAIRVSGQKASAFGKKVAGTKTLEWRVPITSETLPKMQELLSESATAVKGS